MIKNVDRGPCSEFSCDTRVTFMFRVTFMIKVMIIVLKLILLGLWLSLGFYLGLGQKKKYVGFRFLLIKT